MAKENPTQVDELNKKIEFLNQELLKANERIISTNERLISVMEMALNQVPQPANTRPPKVDYDNSDHDDYLNKQIEESTIRKGMTSQAYNGRVVSIHLIGEKEIQLRQQSHHLRMEYGDGYKPLNHTLGPETFFLTLEAMLYAEKHFGLDRKAALEKLTGGEGLAFKDIITLV